MNSYAVAVRRLVQMGTSRWISTSSTLASRDGGSSSGSGYGGSIREGGGKFSEIEAANENVYFKRLEAQQLEALKKKHDEEIANHEKEIQRHQDAIKRHREKIKELPEDVQKK